MSERTLADLLKSQGYATGLVGKWHSGRGASRHPMQRLR
ncbi:MAG: sulfatase-like hydrolase/transferase [Bryobacterales bacterium]